MTRHVFLPAFVLLAASVAQAAEPGFRTDVAPVLVARCVGCHGGQKSKGDYQLRTFAELGQAGASEAAPIVPGKPDESELLRRLVTTNTSERMPPGDDPLTLAEITAIKRWIANGAKFDGPDRTAPLRSYLPPRQHRLAPEKYPTRAPVFAVAFAPDGQELAVGGVHEVTIWNPTSGALLRRLPRLPARIQVLVYSTNGQQLLVGGGTPGEYGEAALIRAHDGARVRDLGTFDDLVLGGTFAPDGQSVALSSADRTARAVRLADGVKLWESALHADWVTGIAYSPDGRFVVTAGKDRTLKVLEAGTGKLYTTYNGHRKQLGPHSGQFAVYAVAFAASGQVFSAGAGDAIRVWEPVKAHDESGSAADLEERFAKGGHTRFLTVPPAKPVFKLAVGGGHVFAAGGDGVVRQFDVAKGTALREYRGHTDWVYALDYHAATNRAASAGFDGEVRIWDTKTGANVGQFVAAPGWTAPKSEREPNEK